MGRSFTCGFCNTATNSQGKDQNSTRRGLLASFVVLCSNDDCQKYNVFDSDGFQYPSPKSNRPIPNLPDDVRRTWVEACQCYGSNCYTASVMHLRKLLMHMAHDKCQVEIDALLDTKQTAIDSKGKTHQAQINFKDYVDVLEASGEISKSLIGKYHEVRDAGNIVNHQLEFVGKREAEMHLDLVQMLLVSLYYSDSAVPTEDKSQTARPVPKQPIQRGA